ncbi:OB-fold domain-containing protein [Pseudohaliea sp.]|uniref:Zn-ribbon domain-containing OB-fold protein n=1 Tax=Pseudohaliea sp. TaxID=2740289 RepID=UPI0032EE1B5B
MSATYLPPGLPGPAPARDGLDAPFWDGLREEKLLLKRCSDCHAWQWGADWLCHDCHSFEHTFCAVEPRGLIYSYERVWHPTHRVLAEACPYLVVLVEIPEAGGVRLVGNLLGDAAQEVSIGQAVEGVFEHHSEGPAPFTLLQWRSV